MILDLGTPWKESYDQPRKSRNITLPAKVCLVKAMVFPVVMYGCETAETQSHDSNSCMELDCEEG